MALKLRHEPRERRQGATTEPSTVVVTHVRGLGPSNHLERHLVGRCGTLLAIDHPLEHGRSGMSTFRLYRSGDLVETGHHISDAPETIRYFSDVLLTIRWTRKHVGRCDLIIGVDALNAITGLLLRVLGLAGAVVFYSIDWSPKRFASRILDCIYHQADRIAAYFTDETWNVSDAMDRGRWRGWLSGWFGNRAMTRSKTVPIGVPSSSLIALDDERRIRHRVAFMGHLLEKQGLQCAIAALPLVAEQIPDVELIVIGSGPFEEQLRQVAKTEGVANRVSFLGYVETESDVLKLLASASIGLAPYLETCDSFTAFADPAKVKSYLAAGLPVVLTALPPIAATLERRGCGVIAEATSESLAAAVTNLLLESEYCMARRRSNAVAFVRYLGWDAVFGRALEPFVGSAHAYDRRDKPLTPCDKAAAELLRDKGVRSS